MENNNPEFEISRTTLSETPDIQNIETVKVNTEITEQNNKLIETQLNSQLSLQDKIVNNVNSKKEDIRKTLIPFIISLLTPFGNQAVQAITSKLPAEQIKDLVQCPSSAKINELIKKRNSLVIQINHIFNTIQLITKTLNIESKIITSIQVGINAISLIPPSTLPGATIIAYDKINKLLLAANVVVNTLSIALASYGVYLKQILDLLNNLDMLLQQCAQDNNMDFEQVNNEINALANPTVVATQSEDNTYKGFTLGVKIDETNESKYIKRYAVAQNKQGVDILRTESSFASDPSVLINQLKFIIDSSPNITAE